MPRTWLATENRTILRVQACTFSKVTSSTASSCPMAANIACDSSRMPISRRVAPSARTSAHAVAYVRVDVPSPGMVTPITSRRGSPIRSAAWIATSSAWVESRPPETPITSRRPSAGSERSRCASAVALMRKISRQR